MLHIDILNQILSFSIFSFIKGNSKNGNDFITCVLNSEPEKTKKLINNYISKFKDSYSTYLEHLIGYTEIDTEVNKKIANIKENNFSDNSQDSQDSQVSQIILSTKPLF